MIDIHSVKPREGLSAKLASPESIAGRVAPYEITARSEMAEQVNRLSAKVAERFEADLYPRRG